MKTKTYSLSAFIAFLLISCQQGNVYSKFDNGFSNNRWEKTNTKTYDFSIEDETKQYNIVLRFGHVYDYQFATVPIAVTITDPSGKEEKITVPLKIKDDSGKQLGECAGDICDVSFTVKNKANLAKGNYKVAISNSFNGPYLPNVLGIGLDVEIAE